MKKFLLAILLLLLTTNLYASPTNSISVTPVAVDGAVIQAADENNRNSTISSAYNSHSHEDITKLGTVTTGVWNGTAVTDTYLSQITTAGKVSGAALTGFASIPAGAGEIPDANKGFPIVLTTDITGTLPIANGGTNSTSTTYCNLTTNVTGVLPLANGGTAGTTGMKQIFTSSGTFTAPTGVTTVYLTMVGSGGGGAGGNTTGGNGGTGGNVTFDTVVIALGGGGGLQNAGTVGAGGGVIDETYNTGMFIGIKGANGGLGNGAEGGRGGGSTLGNGGVGGFNAHAAIATLGYGGGGGGGGGNVAGSGGGGGQAVINLPYTVVPGNNYTVVVGDAGTAGASATYDGSIGKKGVCIVEW